MGKMKKQIISILKNPKADFRVKIFNVLAFSGAVVSGAMGVGALYTGLGWNIFLADMFLMFLSAALLYYANKRGRYQFCYTVCIIVIFVVGFSYMFVNGGGYYSGMPSFFIFAIVFTVYMMENRGKFVVAGLELLLYIGLCCWAYYYPAEISWIESESNRVLDIVIGILAVSMTLAITMNVQFAMYRAQQKELEHAREAAEDANRAKSSFLANMNHEMRTPINVIMGINEMIIRESRSDEIRDYAKKIRNAGEMMVSLINNILDMAKIEVGKIVISETEYKIGTLLDEVTLLGRSQAENKGLKFSTEIAPAFPAVLCGDYMHIKQIILNFLSNAAKYTFQGEIALHFGLEPMQEEHWIMFCIQVSDTGIGMKEGDLESIFDTFTRVERSECRNIEGTGLGLSIAKELTELLSGTISVESTYGKGSVFRVRIPQKVTGMEIYQAHKSTEDNEGCGIVAPEGRVLVVDDTPENLQVVERLLERTLMQIDTARSGKECLQAVREKEYHLIFMDYMMPGMDGLETFRRLRQENPSFSVPVVALTANALSETGRMLLEKGFSRYLLKPVDWRELEQAICDFLPPELLVAAVRDKHWKLSDDEFKQISEKLRLYDLNLKDGLSWLDGDFGQFLRLAADFIRHQPQTMENIRTLLEAEDLENLVYEVHSLKANGRAMGAAELYDLAARMEIRCRQGDVDYVRQARWLLEFEWKRAMEGLRWLLDNSNKEEKWDSKEIFKMAMTQTKMECEQRIRIYLDSLQCTPAIRELEYLEKQLEEDFPKQAEKIRMVREQAGRLEFEKAQSLYSEYLNLAQDEVLF